MGEEEPDYTFMRSGLELSQTGGISESQSALNVASLVATFTENALKESSKYVEHANRNVITKEDIKLCLMTETFKFFDRENIEDDIQKWKDIIDEEESESSSEEDYIEELTEDPFHYSECECDMCVNIKNIEGIWCNWVPNEGIESILKNVIDTQI